MKILTILFPAYVATGLEWFGDWDPGITPGNGLPGIAKIKEIAGGILTFATIFLVIAFVVACILWAFGTATNNPSLGSGAKTGAVVTLIAALLAGAGSFLVGWFGRTGSQISGADFAHWILAGSGLV